MPKRPHLFVFTAKDCHFCDRFKEEVLPGLLRKYGMSQVSVIDINYLKQVVTPSEVEKIKRILGSNPNFHPQVLNMRMAPAIGMVSKSSWDDKEGLLKGFLYGGEIQTTTDKNGQPKNIFSRVKTSGSLDFSSIDAWIQRKKKDPFFTEKGSLKTEKTEVPLLGRTSQITYRHRDVLQ